MPNFDRDALRKGGKAIDDALEARKNGGDFKPFLSNIFWKEDKDSRYLLFLNPIEEIPQVDFYPYIDLDDGRPHQVMARTDPSIGAKKDPIHDQWNYKPRLTNIAIAVELEPTMTIVNGREKPTGFEVATRTFDRKIKDANGESTDDYEEVTVPVVGVVAQSPHNFFNALRSFDTTEGEVHSTPLKITRLGKKDNVSYTVTGYEVDLDRSNLLDFIENLSYIEDPAQLLEDVSELDDAEASIAIGDYLLYKQLEEYADEDTYNAILSQITKPARFGDTKKEKKDRTTTRQAKPSQRRGKSAAQEESSDDPEESVSKASPPSARLARLKEIKSKSKAAAEKAA